jgi:hypothetical protein
MISVLLIPSGALQRDGIGQPPLAPAHHAIGLAVHLDLGIFVRQ